MAGVLDIMMQVSAPVKLAWVLCLAWAVVQLEWYKRARLADEGEEVAARPAARRQATVPAPRPEMPAETEMPAEIEMPAETESFTEGLEHMFGGDGGESYEQDLDSLDEIDEGEMADAEADAQAAAEYEAPLPDVALADSTLAEALDDALDEAPATEDEDDDLWSRVVANDAEALGAEDFPAPTPEPAAAPADRRRRRSISSKTPAANVSSLAHEI